jgi:hypothetical protein
MFVSYHHAAGNTCYSYNSIEADAGGLPRLHVRCPQ